MPLTLASSGGGSVTITVPSTASGYTLTLPAVTGNVAVDGPAFSAYQSSSQTYTSGYNKVALQAEEFDTANCFDTTTYRFTPTVAGYYQFNFSILTPSASRASENQVFLYKNGSSFKSGIDIIASSGIVLNSSALAYANGTTDYFEFYAYIGTGGAITGQATYTYFQGVLVRAA